MRVHQLLHAIGCKYRYGLWLSSGTNETVCSSSYEEHSVLSVPLKTMNVPLESLSSNVTICFREVLETAANRPCWWYGVKSAESDPDSLAQLCGLSTIEMESMFKACGFILPGKFNRDALKNFAKEIRTCDVTSGKPAGFTKKQMFLKIGTGTTQGVASQYKRGSKLVRPSSSTRSLKACQKLLQESILEWKRMSETIRQMPSTPTGPSTAPSDTVERPPSTPTPLKHISGVAARYEFLIQFIKPEALTSTDLWQDDVDEQDFVAAIEKFVAVRREANDVTSPIRALLGAKKISESIDDSRFPLMKKKGINLRDNHEIQVLLRELVMLNDEVESVRVLEYSAYNDAPQTLLKVPRSSRKDLFDRNAKRTGWIDKLLLAVLPEEWEEKDANELEDEDEIGANLSVAAWWLIRFLGNRHPDEFIKAANDIGMPIHSQPMDEDQAFAMFRDANIGVRAARIIRKHFLAHFGTTFLASEVKVRRLGNNALPPTVKQFKYKERRYDYWYHEVDQIIEHNLALELLSASTAPNWTSIEIIFGGDHGQRAFRSGAKLILRGPMKVVKEFPIGEIEISKDNAEILDNTLFEPFNNGIDRMTNGATCTGIDPDGSIRILSTVDGVLYAKFGFEKHNENDELLVEVPFRVFMTGDLAYYAICHGKENSTSHWCPWCMLSHANWQTSGHELGELWDLGKIEAIADELACEGESTREKGVTTMALVWTIAIDRYVCPPLHMVLGTGNTILSDFIGWIDKRDGLESLPQSLLTARAEFIEAVSDVQDFKEEQTVWVQLEGPGLAELRIENKRLVAFLKRTTLSEEERNAAVEQKAAATQQIKELVQDKKEIDESLKYVRDAAKEKKKLLEAEEKEFPMASRAVRAVIEQDFLKPNGVDRAAHHGGDLTGPSVRNLMSKADLIFGGIKEYLISKTLVEEEEIIDRCNRTATCLTLFDGLFSSIYKTTEQVNEDFEGALAEARDFATKAVASWRSLGLSVTLKAHIAEDHVCGQIRDYHGIGDYNEEFVERLHQEGVRTNRRVQTMKDTTKKYLHVARYQEATQNPKVREMQTLVHEKRKRKCKASEEEDEVLQLQSQLRHQQRVSERLKAASACEQHAEPLMSARNHNVNDFRSNR
jgi:hypothetical protein